MSSVHSPGIGFSPGEATPNRILTSLPAEELERLSPHLRKTSLRARQVIVREHDAVNDILFPSSCICARTKVTEDGRSVELAMIGSEGVIDSGGLLVDEASSDVVVYTAGDAWVLPAVVFRAELDRGGELFRLTRQYAGELAVQLLHSACCAARHSVTQRCARWLLMTQSRRGAEFALTHDALAAAMGVRRPTITLVLDTFVRTGIIRRQRGRMVIHDPAALEAASCRCPRVSPWMNTEEGVDGG